MNDNERWIMFEHEQDDRRTAGVILWVVGTLATACVAATGVLAYLSVTP